MVSEAQRDRLGAVGVVQISGNPKGELHAGARGAAGGAAEGAATGAGAGAVAAAAPLFVGFSCSGNSAAWCVILLPVFVVGGAVVGGVVGAAQAVPVDTGREIEAQLNRALAETDVQEALRTEVVKAAARAGVANVQELAAAATTADFRELQNAKVDTVLEVGLVEVGLIGRGGKDPLLTLHVHALARLVDVNSNAELYRDYPFNHVSPPRKFSEWSADQSRLLKRELDRAIETLGASIVDEVFLMVRNN